MEGDSEREDGKDSERGGEERKGEGGAGKEQGRM